MSVSDGAVSFTRTAPAASVIAWAQDPRLQDPLHCANLLLQEFDDPSGILQSALLLGLVIRCASQIALDYRRVEGPTGCLDTQLTRTNSGGSCCDLHLLRRRSGPSHDGGQRYEVQHTTPALGSTTDAAMLHGLQRRIMYITDSHVEDSGIKEGAPPSVVLPYPSAHSEEEPSQIGSNTDVSTDGVDHTVCATGGASGRTASAHTASGWGEYPETAQADSRSHSREAMPIAVPVPASLRSAGFIQQHESFQETQCDSTQESQLSQEHESTFGRNRMNLSSADIERWIDGIGPSNAMPRVLSTPNIMMAEATAQNLNNRALSRLQHSDSKQLNNRASWASATSNSRFGAEKLLRSSIQVPRAMVVSCSTGSIVCRDAVHSIHRKDVSKFPWQPTCWSSSLMASVLSACSTTSVSAEEVRGCPILLLHIDNPDDLPANFPRLLKMWLAMYPSSAIKCYTTGKGSRFTDESGFLFLEGVNISSVRTFAESANCCMLFAPVYHHLVMAFDIAHLGPTSSAWQLQDNTTQNIWRRMHSVEYSRLHVTPTFIAVCFHQGLDKMLQQVFATAVEGVYSQQQPVRADTDGDTIMFCFSAALDREAPNVVSEFVRDICAETRGDDAVCALLVVSLPEMRMAQIHCTALPTVEYVRGAIEAYFRKDLTFSPLNMRQSRFGRTRWSSSFAP